MPIEAATSGVPAARPAPWLFSRSIDLWAFGGSALASLLLLVVGYPLGLLNSDSPEWTWITCVLLVDVAHVYATGFRVYFDREELRRRPALYFGTPLAALALGWAVYSEDHTLYWRLLAYLAVFHFVRQQYGWVMLYRAKAGERDRLGRVIDTAAIYLATLHPLAVWHARLPRRFDWIFPGDFAALPEWLPWITGPLWALALAAYTLKSLFRGFRQHDWNPGKDLVVATTAICWYAGIVAFNSDYAFTVTNVVIHGVPYMVLLYVYWQRRTGERWPGSRWSAVGLFLGTVWLLAFAEELLWDRGVWHERPGLFGFSGETSATRDWLVPLLGVPQLTHYVLDGFLWKRRSNRQFDSEFAVPDGERSLPTG